MANSSFSVGERVARLNDGATGVVSEVGMMGGLLVRWDASGVVSVVVPAQLHRI